MGSSQTGLVGTIGITLLNPDGTVHTVRTIAGIYEIGGGYYGKNISFPDNWKGIVKWDTGGGSPVYDCEAYTVDGLVDALPADTAEAVWLEDLDGYTSGAAKLMQALTFGKEVMFDAVNGEAGTAFPIGTRAHPSNNLTDTLAICAARGLIRIMLRSSVTIGAGHNIDNISLETHGIMGTNVIFQAGCSANNATLRHVNVSGVLTNGDVLLIEDCSVGSLANFTGIMNICAFGEGGELILGIWANMIECYCGGEPTNEPEINLGTAALSMPCYCGNVKFTNKTGGVRTVASFRSGSVTIASSCVAGKIQIMGTGEIEKDDSGPGCQVDIDAALTSPIIAGHVWAAIALDNVKSGSFGEKMVLLGGLAQDLYYLDQTSYDGAHRLLSGRIRIYSVAGSVGTDADVFATYIVTATWSDTELQTYKVVKQ